MKKLMKAFQFSNGNWVAFDANDEQIPELQKLHGYTFGEWFTAAIKLGYDITDCQFKVQS